MSRLGANVTANLIASAWTAATQLAFIPLFVHLAGIEAYGLVGFSLVLIGTIQALDFGLAATLNRELAIAKSRPEKAAYARDLCLTLMVAAWVLGACLGITLFLSAPYLSTHWFRGSSLASGEITFAVRMMGILAALQWPFSLAQGGLQGLERQVLLSVLRVTAVTGAAGATLLALSRRPGNSGTYFICHAVVILLQTALLTGLLRARLPASERPARIHGGVIRSSGGFAAGMLGINLSALMLMHGDKALLSRWLTLEQFGYYSLASAVGLGFSALTTPVFDAYFPRLASLFATGRLEELRTAYHRGAILLIRLVGPLTAALICFPMESVWAWTGNPVTASHLAAPVRLLVVGTLLNAIMVLPFTLQLAMGRVRMALLTNLCLVALLLSVLPVLTFRYGMTGAAATWPLLNASYLLVALPLIHCRLLQARDLLAYLRALTPPLLVSFCLPLLLRPLLGPAPARSAWFIFLCVTVSAAYAVNFGISRRSRGTLLP